MQQYTFKTIGQQKYSVTFVVLAYLVEVRLGLEWIVYKDTRFTSGNALNNCTSKYNIKKAHSLCLPRLLEDDGFFFCLFFFCLYSISFTSIHWIAYMKNGISRKSETHKIFWNTTTELNLLTRNETDFQLAHTQNFPKN